MITRRPLILITYTILGGSYCNYSIKAHELSFYIVQLGSPVMPVNRFRVRAAFFLKLNNRQKGGPYSEGMLGSYLNS